MPEVTDFGRDQQVEQQDHREGEDEVGEEGQHGVEPAAEVARRQAQRDADHEGEDRGGGRDLDQRPCRAPITMRLNTSRARLSPPSR